MSKPLRSGALGALLLLAPGCAPGGPAGARRTPGQSPSALATPSAPASPTPSPAPAAATASAAPVQAGSVFLIVMENKTAAAALDPGAAPYTAALARRYGSATAYHAVSHPSLPNYLALTSGSTWGIADDGYHRLPAGGIGAQLSAAGIPWRAYLEGMSHGCFGAGTRYAVKHNPFAYYGGACPPNVVSLDPLAADLRAGTPRFLYIKPDLCHDTHDCPVASGDAWLRQWVGAILASPAWRAGGTLFLTWDEGTGSNNRVAALVIRPDVAGRTSARAYDHYSLLATIEDLLGVPRLGQAARANPMRDLLG
ncbi:MAG TPA: alkaline phosphatase family protein [Candidatus Dormibacteraeota bacterium]|nr:alkaline phosphatase family protein [Candidatus Dormibacteraeota bacterium]